VQPAADPDPVAVAGRAEQEGEGGRNPAAGLSTDEATLGKVCPSLRPAPSLRPTPPAPGPADEAQLRLCSRARGARQAAGGAGLTNKKYTEPYTGESYYVEAVAGAGGRRAQTKHILMHDAMYDKARPRERTAASHACVRATRPW